MTFLSISTDRQKVGFLRTCAGPELTEVWEKATRIRFTALPGNETAEIAAVLAHTFI